jgi:hypothetical protein
MAITRYLARKHNIYGDLKQGAVADMIIDGLSDFWNKVSLFFLIF